MESDSTQPLSSNLRASWDGIAVEYTKMPPDESDVNLSGNLISVAFAAQERATWRVDSGSSQTTSVPPGSLFLYSSRQFVWSRWEQPTECLHIALAPDLLTKVATGGSVSGNVELDYRAMFTDLTILHIGYMLKSELQNGGLAGRLYTESLANVLAVHLLRNYSESVVKPTLRDEPLDALKLNQLKEFIEEHLGEDLTIANMAGVVHMSSFHFARAFKSVVGQPPHRYLTQRRIERAKILLSVTRLPVAEVAYRVGCTNQSHFTAQFRKATGVTPKVYRDSL